MSAADDIDIKAHETLGPCGDATLVAGHRGMMMRDIRDHADMIARERQQQVTAA